MIRLNGWTIHNVAKGLFTKVKRTNNEREREKDGV